MVFKSLKAKWSRWFSFSSTISLAIKMKMNNAIRNMPATMRNLMDNPFAFWVTAVVEPFILKLVNQSRHKMAKIVLQVH